jgi:hypothetical protein
LGLSFAGTIWLGFDFSGEPVIGFEWEIGPVGLGSDFWKGVGFGFLEGCWVRISGRVLGSDFWPGSGRPVGS